MTELILGGARSGKSLFAEQHAAALASGVEGRVVYVATASADDAEMGRRIASHQQRRPRDWHTVEEPLQLATTLQRNATADSILLVDCLTLWLTNHLLRCEQGHEIEWQQQRQQLLALLPKLPGTVILVSNEVGLGVVPMGALTRRFCDETGLLHQELATICDRVTLVCAGLPLQLKGK